MGLSYKGLLLWTVNPSILVRFQVGPQTLIIFNMKFFKITEHTTSETCAFMMNGMSTGYCIGSLLQYDWMMALICFCLSVWTFLYIEK